MKAKKVLSLLIAASLMLTPLLTSCRKKGKDGESRYLRAEVHFDELEYSRPDFDAILALAAEIDEMAENGEDESAVYDAFDELDDSLVSAVTQDRLLSFRQSMDTTDESINAEIDEIAEPLVLCEQAYFRLAAKLLDGKYEDALFGDLTDDEKQEIRDEAEALDDDYVALSKRQTEIVNKYTSNLTLETVIDGETLTLAEVLEKYDENTYYEELNKVCGPLYLELIDVGKKMAEKRGYDSFAECAYADSYGRDFTPEQSDRLSEYVKEYILPLYFSIVSVTDGYDNDDEFNIFDHEKELREYFASIDPRMLDAYDYMKEFGLYVIDGKDVMQPGAYTTYLDSYDVPLIFIRTEGTYADLETFIHEFGHFYSFYLYGSDLDYNIDIDEIHSQGNEALFLPVWKDIFGSRAFKSISGEIAASYLESIIFACLIDHFEQLVYSSDVSTVEEVNGLFKKAYADFGLLDNGDYIWTMIHHLYQVPMYYISYGTSLIPTLEIYVTSLDDYKSGVALYNEIMAYSAEAEGFCDLAENTSLSDPFAEDTIKKICDKLEKHFID